MRVTPALVLVVALLFAVPAFAQKVYFDFDGATAFSEYKTFQLRESPHDLRRSNPALHRQMVEQLTAYAEEGGLTPAESDPDVYMTFHAAYLGDLRLALTDLDYAYGDGFTLGEYWEGGTGTRQISKTPLRFKEGSVIVDVWDRERGVLVWRGIASANIRKDNAKNAKTLDKALRKLMKKWEDAYGGRARAIRKMKAEQGG